MILIALNHPKPSDFAYLVFRLTLALSAAGVAAVIPGFISVKFGSTVRAGGAIAVFALVFYTNPASLVVEDEEIVTAPPPGAMEAAESYLEKADTLDVDTAWSNLSATAKKWYPYDFFKPAYENVRVPLGNVEERNFVGAQKYDRQEGWPNGLYYAFLFTTTFSSGSEAMETIGVMKLSASGQWEPAGHTVLTK